MFTIKELVDELKKQECYTKFIKDNKDAFLCAGFFVINPEGGDDKFQLDFYLPKKKQIAISEYPFKEIRIQKDKMESIMPIDEELIQVDLSDIGEIVEEAKAANNNEQTTTKIIAVLKDGIWNLTCMSNTLDLIRIKVSASNEQILQFEKVGLMEMVRVERKDMKKDEKNNKKGKKTK
jgi:hypothetical protein